MADSRTRNTARNIAAGIVNRIVSIIFPFLNRTVILWVMGAEYTGLSGLFSAILEVLSLAELGFNTAIVYCMYKPMAEGDREKVRCYLTLIRKIYAIVGAVILAAGLCVTPFLTRLIHGTYPETINLYALYLLYLLNTVVSYFLFAYKETVLLADQRQDLTSNIRTAVNVIRYIAQFAALLITRNFYVYVLLLVAGTVVSNVLIQRCALKRYPDLICRKKQRLQMPAELKRQVGALLLGRMSDKFRNSFDSIIVRAGCNDGLWELFLHLFGGIRDYACHMQRDEREHRQQHRYGERPKKLRRHAQFPVPVRVDFLHVYGVHGGGVSAVHAVVGGRGAAAGRGRHAAVLPVFLSD